jgi:hypothetical protein
MTLRSFCPQSTKTVASTWRINAPRSSRRGLHRQTPSSCTVAARLSDLSLTGYESESEPKDKSAPDFGGGYRGIYFIEKLYKCCGTICVHSVCAVVWPVVMMLMRARCRVAELFAVQINDTHRVDGRCLFPSPG